MTKYAPLLTALFLLQSASAVHLRNPSHTYPTASTAILRSKRGKSSDSSASPIRFSASNDNWLEHDDCDDELFKKASRDVNDDDVVHLCSASSIASPSMNPVVKNLFRGAFLRVASDLTGGTPLENIKLRVATTSDGPLKATREIINGTNGVRDLWSGTPGRIIEGSLLGGIFMVASMAAKKQVISMGGSTTAAALAGGIVGGVAQASIMTPSGLIFTSLIVNKDKPGHENDNSFTVAKRLIEKNGIQGMFVGGGPMAARQATNWASRSLMTEVCRTTLKLSRFGSVGEIASGVIGGVTSCWNTPLETVRVLMQRDISAGVTPKTYSRYIGDVVDEAGVVGLYRGVSPRALQATWQTVFMVVVPNILGV